MEIQPSASNTKKQPPPKDTNTTKPPPRRRLTTEDGSHALPNKRIRVPPVCFPAMTVLKQELGLRSDSQTLHWLVHHVKPQLVVPPPPPPTKPNKSQQPQLSYSSHANQLSCTVVTDSAINGLHANRLNCTVVAESETNDSHANRSSCTLVKDSVVKEICMEDFNHYKHVSYLPDGGGGEPVVKQFVRATVVQAASVFFDTPATLDKAERLIAGAAAYGSKIVVFPEAFVGGYPRCMELDVYTTDDYLNKFYASAINIPGPEVHRLANVAAKYRVQLVIGVVERAGFCLFSTVLFFDSLGQYLGRHRKLMPMPSEAPLWYSGDKSSPPVYDTAVGKIGGLVCWDSKFPVLRTELYTKGIDIYCAPNADAREIWKASMIHIAVEGSCFLLSANQFCQRRDYPVTPGDKDNEMSPDAIMCAGGSVIVSPSGTILAGPNYQEECLISADLDLLEITRAKAEFGMLVTNLKPNNEWASSEPDQFLYTTDVKVDESNQLSWSL